MFLTMGLPGFFFFFHYKVVADSCLRQTNSSGVESEPCVCESEYYESLHFRDFVFVSRNISVFFFLSLWDTQC